MIKNPNWIMDVYVWYDVSKFLNEFQTDCFYEPMK